MRLHRVALSNLGALYGAHEVDFDRALGGAPLFLISGLTGSGKSTLLDAVCLALFGQTPRLGREATQEASELQGDDVRRLMSEGTDDSSAELEWSRLVRGERTRYRASWRCHRLRSGQLSRVGAAVRTLVVVRDDGEERLVESARPREYRPPFESALGGFSLESFLRSTLLAQGEFAAFLEASDRERAAILERLTGTAQYDRIGQRAAEQLRELDATHQALVQEAEAVGLVEDDGRDDLARLAEAVEVARRALAEIDANIAAARARGEAEAALSAARDAFSALVARETSEVHAERAALQAYEAAAPSIADVRARQARVRALGALEVAGPAALEAARVRRGVALEALDAVRARANGLSLALDRARVQHQRALERDRLDTEVSSERESIARLDHDLERWSRRDEATLLAAPELSARLATARSLEQEAQRARAEVEDPAGAQSGQLQASTLELEAGKLRADLTELAARLDALAPAGVDALWGEARARVSVVSEASARARHLERARAEAPGRAGARARAEALKDELTALEVARRAALEDHARARRDLERAEIEARAEHLRAALVEGEPCPVCGSSDHPARPSAARSPERPRAAEPADAAESPEPPPPTERAADGLERAGVRLERLARRAESLSRSLAHAEQAATTDPAVGAWLERLAMPLAEAAEWAAREHHRHRLDLEALEARARAASDLLEGRERLRRDLEIVEARRAAAEDAGRERQGRRSKATALESAAANAGSQLRARLRELRVELDESATSQVGDVREAAPGLVARGAARELEGSAPFQGASLEPELESAIARLAAAAAGFSPTAREALLRLRAPRASALDAAVRARDALGDVGDTASAEVRRSTLETEAARTLDELARAEGEANAASRAFETEAARQHAEDEARARLEGELAELDAGLRGVDVAALEALDPDRIPQLRFERTLAQEARVAAIDAVRRAEDRLRELEAGAERAMETLEADRDAASEHLGRARFELDSAAARTATRVAHAALRVRLIESARALSASRRLYELVGRDDELKLFAQSLNLENLLEIANHHLAWVAPRYVLVASRDVVGPSRLSFTVRDRELGDAERGVRTLSRGESFLVALALALALAGFEASELKIETLLIDHGFGSLDGESLDRALEVVSQLGPRGVQVGLIGHVPELEARIRARIHLEPIGGGRSRILGVR